jgi:hypothetical protein
MALKDAVLAIQIQTGSRMQYLFRFVVGGAIVALFATVGGALKPKSFAGLFGAAPSVALATLGLTIYSNGKAYASVEARSMIAGAIALALYSAMTTGLIMKFNLRAMSASILAIPVWLITAVGIWITILR